MLMVYEPVDAIEVYAWGRQVGALAKGPTSAVYTFAYTPSWRRTGVELDPLNMPLSNRTGRFNFPHLPEGTYKQLPAVIADSLPDTFGGAIVTAALQQQGVSGDSITSLDRLAYLGNRGIGALEYRPSRGPHGRKPTAVHMNEVVAAARQVLSGNIGIDDDQTRAAILNLIQISTSAGGARAKATVWWSPETGDMTTSPSSSRPDLAAWLMKLDGVGDDGNLGPSQNYTRTEYAYSQMAKSAGITMMDTRLLEENERAHFMTARFDRQDGTKQHIATLCALGHLDFKQLATHSYDQYFDVINRLELTQTERRQAFLRMVFNIYAANCDDHTKNFSFLRRENGPWELAPAYDITYAYRPGTNNAQHLMGVNGKFLDIGRNDLLQFADRYQVAGAKDLLSAAADTVDSWTQFAHEAGVDVKQIERIGEALKSMRPV